MSKPLSRIILNTQNLKLKSNNLGFTLVELLVAITIVVVLSAIGIAGFNSANRVSAIQQQAGEVKSLARKLRTDASAAVKPLGDCVTLPGKVSGTYMYFRNNSRDYFHGVACFDSSGTSLAPMTRGELPENMRFSVPGGNNYLAVLFSFDGQVGTYTFNLAGNPAIQETDFAPPIPFLSDPTTLRIEYNNGTNPYFVYFNRVGLICEQRVTPSTCAN